MTGADLAAALVERGLDPAAERAKASLFDVVLGAFQHVVGARPADAWWVPGRLEVFGKHTDYAGGRTLVCAVPNGLAVAARRRADGVIRVVDAARGDRLILPTRRSARSSPAGGTTSRSRRGGWPPTFPARPSAPTSSSPAICRAPPA